MQPSLFDLPSGFDVRVPAARRSRTSREAARRLLASAKQGSKVRVLLRAYATAGVRGLTDSEAQASTGLPRQSICSLRAHALKQQWVVQTARERVGEYGFNQSVYRITARGVAACA